MKKLSGVFICLLLFTFISSARIIEVADAGITDKLRAVIAAKNAGGAPPGGCATQSPYSTGVVEDNRQRVYYEGSSVERLGAQTFDPGKTGDIYSVTLSLDDVEANQNLTVRVSTNGNGDCSTNYVEEVIGVTTGDSTTEFEVLFDSENRIGLTNAATATICWTGSGAAGPEDLWVNTDSSSPTYAGGQYWWTGNSDWDVSGGGDESIDWVISWKICD